MDTEIMESELLQEKEVTKESGDDSGHATETEDEDSHDQDHDKDHDKEDIHHSSSPDTHTDQPYERQIGKHMSRIRFLMHFIRISRSGYLDS